MLLNVFTSFIHLYKPLLVRLPSVCPSICPSIHLSVHWFVTKLFLRLSVASLKVILNVIVCSSVCLPNFSKSADARDLGLMTLFYLIFNLKIKDCCNSIFFCLLRVAPTLKLLQRSHYEVMAFSMFKFSNSGGVFLHFIRCDVKSPIFFHCPNCFITGMAEAHF